MSERKTHLDAIVSEAQGLVGKALGGS